jgi:alginate O-acetyltransferase complex protein AlgI
VIGHIYGILTFVVGWVFFRADSLGQGFELVKRMFCPWLYADVNSRIGTMISTQSWIACILGILGAGVLAELFKTRSLQPVAAKWKNSIPEAVFLAAMLFVVFVLTASGSYNAFIYTRF